MNEPHKDVIRVVLEGNSKSAYEKMSEALKAENQHIKYTPSKLVGCIIERFSKVYFDQEKGMLAAEFFDSKEHLKETLKTAQTPEELEKALTHALERLKNGTGESLHKRRGRRPKINVVHSDNDLEESKTPPLGSVG
jgi:hypothetical protein